MRFMMIAAACVLIVAPAEASKLKGTTGNFGCEDLTPTRVIWKLLMTNDVREAVRIVNQAKKDGDCIDFAPGVDVTIVRTAPTDERIVTYSEWVCVRPAGAAGCYWVPDANLEP